jgi:hypothetical protein
MASLLSRPSGDPPENKTYLNYGIIKPIAQFINRRRVTALTGKYLIYRDF